jgi:hypothetical protein
VRRSNQFSHQIENIEQRGEGHPGQIGNEEPGGEPVLVPGKPMKVTIETSIARMIGIAHPGVCSAKKTGDQRKFRPSCTHQAVMAPPVRRRIQMRQPATAIMR